MHPVFDLSLRNRHRWQRLDLRLMRKIVAAATAEMQALPRESSTLECQVAIFFVGSRKIARLNQEYVGHSGPTDVITFDYDRPEVARPDEVWLRGDLFICIDEARHQAQEFATTWQSELTRYVIHGLLHLLGYDDREVPDRKAMKHVEGRLLNSVSRQFELSELDQGRKAKP